MRRNSWTAKAGLVAGSVVVALVLLELACRVVTLGPGSLIHWTNLARLMMSDDSDEQRQNNCGYRHDATLGWALPANCASADFNIDAGGLRLTPVTPAAAEPPKLPPILATGSSFTAGAEVKDAETWPTYLQALSGRKVLNAGVSGYSLDQTVPQAERLAAQLKPLVVLVDFTPGDIWRNELRVAYSREKPAFAVIDGQLKLLNVPIPSRRRPALPLLARLLGWSALAHEVVERLGIRNGWYYEEVRASPDGTGRTIACLLMPRLARITAQVGAPVVMMVQYGRSYWAAADAYRAKADADIAQVLGCAAKAGLVTFDLKAPLKAAIAAHGLDSLYRGDHHTPQGNRLVADLMHNELLRRNLLPPASGPQSE